MIAKKYTDIKRYLSVGALPNEFSSTVSNFRKECTNYQISADGSLVRNGLKVARYALRTSIFEEFHSSHSVTSLNHA